MALPINIEDLLQFVVGLTYNKHNVECNTIKFEKTL